jgi:DNA-binding LacI/PurR family transcriptional regulator
MTDVERHPPRPVVMADVARLAGVSHQTVSRVINDSPNLRPETRRRVQEAIDRLGYRPNTLARALVRGRTEVIGLISTGSTYFGPTSIQRSIEEAASASGLFASSVSLPSLTRASLDAAVEHLLRQLVEGIIIIAGQDDALEIARSRNVSVPIVLVEGDLSRAKWTVGVDQIAGARLATKHLLDLGHREIAHLAGPQDWSEARARHEGWRMEMAAAGLRPPEPLIGDWSAEFGYSAGPVIAADHSITAVFAANDQIAIGLLSALHQAGRRVPEDISIVAQSTRNRVSHSSPEHRPARLSRGRTTRRRHAHPCDLRGAGARSRPHYPRADHPIEHSEPAARALRPAFSSAGWSEIAGRCRNARAAGRAAVLFETNSPKPWLADTSKPVRMVRRTYGSVSVS